MNLPRIIVVEAANHNGTFLQPPQRLPNYPNTAQHHGDASQTALPTQTHPPTRIILLHKEVGSWKTG
jgi:hypothetical protein